MAAPRSVITVLIAAALSILALAGCGATSQPTNPRAGQTGLSPAAPAETTPRGTIPKRLGEEAGLTNIDGSTLLTFTINEISATTKCQGGAFGKKAQGRYISLQTTVHTKDDPNNALALFTMSHGWEHVTADGVTTEASTFDGAICAGSGIMDYGPNRTYNETIVLDVPKDSKGGVIVFRPAGNPGWEWQLDT